MALGDDTLKLNLDINGNKARNELGKLEQSTKGLKDTNKDLRVELQKMEAAGKKNTDEYKRLKNQISSNNATITKNSDKMKGLRKEIGLNGLTAKQLRQEYRRLKTSMDNVTPGTPKWKEYDQRMQSVKKRMDQVNTGSRKAGRSFGLFKELLPIAGVGALASVLKNAVGEMFNLAKVMEADAIRSSQVFGDHLGYVTAEAEKLAAKMGLTTREFVSAATATGDLLIPLDFTREQAADMSVELQGLSGALDEWTGGTYGAAGVAQILTKAMLGENEQLKQLGIAIRQDSEEFKDLVAVKEEAEGVTNAQARALATLELIQKKSTDAQAAYNREGNKLLRMQKSISAGWKEMKENVIKYFQESDTEQLKNQRDQVELLTTMLYDNNLEEKRRVELLNELKSIAPEVAATFDDEKKATDATRIALEKYNEQMIMKAVLSKQSEEIDKAASKAEKQKNKEFEALEVTQKAINRYLAKYNELREEGELDAEEIKMLEKANEIRESGLSLLEKSEKLSELDLFGYVESETLESNVWLLRELGEEADEAANYMERLKIEKEKLFREFGIDVGTDDTNNGGTDETSGTKEGTRKTVGNIVYEWDGKQWKKVDILEVEPFDMNDSQKAFEKSLSEMDKVLDEQLDEFTKKWSEYRDIQSEYIPIDQNTHDIALEKIQELYDDQIISYEQYQEAKKAIDARIAEEEEQKRLQRKEVENELQNMEAEQEAQDFEAKLEVENERFNAEMQLLQQRYELEQQMHKGNKDELLKAELEYKQKKEAAEEAHTNKKKDLVQQEIDIEKERLQAAQTVLGGIATALGRENEIAKAALVAKQGVALAEATMALGVGKAKTAAIGFPQNIPAIAGFIAQTAGFIGSIRNALSSADSGASAETEEIPGLQSGGYAERDASDAAPKGVYHANEFVASAPAVRNPTVKPFLDIIDIAQKSGRIATLDLASIISNRLPGRQSGGYANEPVAPSPAAAAMPEVDTEVTNSINRLNSVLERLEENGVPGVWDYDYFNRSNKKMEAIEQGAKT